MFSLIVTLIGVALVIALALAVIYFGGSSWLDSGTKAQATEVLNTGQQMLGAAEVFKAEQGRWPNSVDEMVSMGYLKQVPSINISASEGMTNHAFAGQVTWTMPKPAVPTFQLASQVQEGVCRQVNLQTRGDDGILYKARTTLTTQCFGDLPSLVVIVTKDPGTLSDALSAASVSADPVPTDPASPDWSAAPGAKATTQGTPVATTTFDMVVDGSYITWGNYSDYVTQIGPQQYTVFVPYAYNPGDFLISFTNISANAAKPPVSSSSLIYSRDRWVAEVGEATTQIYEASNGHPYCSPNTAVAPGDTCFYEMWQDTSPCGNYLADFGSGQSVTLQSQCYTPGNLSAYPSTSTFAFGTVSQGPVGLTREVVVRNTGADPVHIFNAYTDLSNSAAVLPVGFSSALPMTVSNSCNGTVAANSSCTLTVLFDTSSDPNGDLFTPFNYSVPVVVEWGAVSATNATANFQIATTWAGGSPWALSAPSQFNPSWPLTTVGGGLTLTGYYSPTAFDYVVVTNTSSTSQVAIDFTDPSGYVRDLMSPNDTSLSDNRAALESQMGMPVCYAGLPMAAGSSCFVKVAADSPCSTPVPVIFGQTGVPSVLFDGCLVNTANMPKNLSSTPDHGPYNGGTRITISGDNISSQTLVSTCPYAECIIDSNNMMADQIQISHVLDAGGKSAIALTTPPSFKVSSLWLINPPYSGWMTAQADTSEFVMVPYTYDPLPTPVVTSVAPQTASATTSTEVLVDIYGSNFSNYGLWGATTAPTVRLFQGSNCFSPKLDTSTNGPLPYQSTDSWVDLYVWQGDSNGISRNYYVEYLSDTHLRLHLDAPNLASGAYSDPLASSNVCQELTVSQPGGLYAFGESGSDGGYVSVANGFHLTDLYASSGTGSGSGSTGLNVFLQGNTYSVDPAPGTQTLGPLYSSYPSCSDDTCLQSSYATYYQNQGYSGAYCVITTTTVSTPYSVTYYLNCKQ